MRSMMTGPSRPGGEDPLLEIPLQRRWAHVQGVAARARSLAPILDDDADLLEAAAWLHDIGYSPDLADTGFHPLDGARYLRDVHAADPALCRLVGNHSCAVIEAERVPAIRGGANVMDTVFGDDAEHKNGAADEAAAP
jgi:HD superfamily phosphodiesterase